MSVIDILLNQNIKKYQNVHWNQVLRRLQENAQAKIILMLLQCVQPASNSEE
jgi:hypothetical protein